MLRFWKKHEKDSDSREKHLTFGSGKTLLKNARSGLNSQWFKSKGFIVLKELEGVHEAKGLVDDSGKERVINSTLNSLEGAIEAFSAEDDKEGLRETADTLLEAYLKIGKQSIINRYMEVCEKADMTEDEINAKLINAADSSTHIDIAVTLYSRVNEKEKLIATGNRALSYYLETSDLDMDSRSRLFDYIVEAYKSAGENELLIKAGDEALKNQIDNRRLSRGKDWVLDAQKAYGVADDKEKLASLGDQYVNLYLKEGMEVWLDKSIPVYEKAGVDYVSKFNHLADIVEEKGHAEVADTLRRKAEKH